MLDTERTSTLASVFYLLKRRKWLIVSCVLSVVTIVASMVLAMPSLYRSSATLIFSPDDMNGLPVTAAAANELELRLGLVRQNLMSRRELQEVIDSFDLYSDFRKTASAESAIERLRNNIGIEQKASTDPQWGQSSVYLVTIEFQDWDPDLAAVVANDLAARFTAESRRIREDQAVSRIAVIAGQLETARSKFMQQEERTEQFKRDHIGELPEQQLYNMATLERLNSELSLNGERQVRMMEQRYRVANGSGDVPATAGGSAGLTRLERATLALQDLQSRYTEYHPDVIRAKKEIEALKAEMAANPDPSDEGAEPSRGQNPGSQGISLAALRQEEMRLRSAIAGVVGKIEKMPAIQGTLKALTLDYDTAKDEYLQLLQLYHEAQLAESVQTHQNQQSRIIEPAIRPEFSVGPDRNRLILVGIIMALGLAGLAAFIAEQNDDSFHSVADVRRFTGVPVLATIPNIRTAGDRVREWTRFGFTSIFLLVGLSVLAGSAYFMGTNAHQLVMALSG